MNVLRVRSWLMVLFLMSVCCSPPVSTGTASSRPAQPGPESNASQPRVAIQRDALGKTPYDYVNPFIGTDEYGHTFPGASAPFGMVQVSPDTATKAPNKSYRWCSGYQYTDTSILGFSHTHLSGTGHSDLGDILVMPTTGEIQLNPGTPEDPDAGYRSRFSHDQEAAQPGYYAVKLADYDIDVELTCTTRVALHKYTFPKDAEANVIIDLFHTIYNFDDKVVWAYLRVVNDWLITGYRQTTGWAKNRKIFFAVSFSKPFTSYGCVKKDAEHYYFRDKDQFLSADHRPFGKKEMSGRKLRTVFSFDKVDEPLLVKVALSGVDQAGALKNLEAEMPRFDFDEVKEQAARRWQQELNEIVVEGSREQKEIFYTAMYHTMLAPMTYCDVDGRYMGLDQQIHVAEDFVNYTTFSLWDTYRAVHPLYTVIKPERVSDMIKSMLAHYEQSAEKALPIWSLHGNETQCMIGYHAASVISDAYQKGIRDYDAEKAFDAVVSSASNPSYDGLGYYMDLGYVPIDKESEAASKTLEYAYDDYTIAKMAEVMGKAKDRERFLKRAAFYRNTFDGKTGFMRARNSDGLWKEPFDPFLARFGGDYTEGNAWQYTWYVPHDVQGLIELMGGRQTFISKLDALFAVETDEEKYASVDDISGLIGQYVHGNEPSHHIAYLYNYAGAPHRTQERINQIVNRFYDNTPKGLYGNEDCGQMSAWYIFSALGFYPVCPGDGTYEIGAPSLQQATVFLDSGKTFEIYAYNLSPQNLYIQSVKLNGREWRCSYLYHEDIAKGGMLEFQMGPAPSKWATGQESLPPSMSLNGNGSHKAGSDRNKCYDAAESN